MRHRSVRLLPSLLLALVVALGGPAVAHAADAGDAVVTISGPAGPVVATAAVDVHVSIANPLAVPISVLAADTPAAGIDAPIFDVRLGGAPVAYLGRLVKRPAPSAGDYLVIQPGATLEYDVDLAESYSFAASGDYAIAYAAPGLPRSNALVLPVAGRPDPVVPSPPGGLAGATTFNGCSVGQQASLTTALADAGAYAASATTYFGSYRAGARYVKWFGAYDATRWTTVRSNYIAIRNVTDNASVHFDCTCTDPYYAYVQPLSPYDIYVCSAFWTAPDTGTDSKAGTLIHEISHFAVVADTDDIVYGQSGAMALAGSNPAQAIRNADSHEYFVENTPVTADSAAAFVPDPTTLAFGGVDIGSSSDPQVVVLTATGDVGLAIGAMLASGDFALSSNTCAGSTLAPLASCAFAVTFTPSATGARTGSIAIATNAVAAPPAVTLSGNGIGAGGGDSTPPTITIGEPDGTPARTKTLTATTDEGTLTMVEAVGATCDGTLAFVAYAERTFESEADNGTRICYSAVDTVGNTSYQLSQVIVGIDRTPPAITIDAQGGDPARTKTVAAVADDGSLELATTTGLACDDALPFAVGSTRTFEAETDIGTRVCFRATDLAGNAGYALSAPVSGIDRTAPGSVSLAEAPAPRTRSTTATFRFVASDASGAPTYRCRLDGGAEATCRSPRTYVGLAATRHVLGVRAVDGAGNVGPVTTRTWVVEAERLANGGLEAYRGGGRIPTGWTASGRLARLDGRSTAFAHDGSTSLRLAGARGRVKRVAQAVALAGEAGDRLSLSVWVRAPRLPAQGACGADVTLYAGAVKVASARAGCGSGRAFARREVTLVAPRAYSRAVVTLTYAKRTGSVWFDSVSLVR